MFYPSRFYTPLHSHRPVRLREKSKKQFLKLIAQGGKGNAEVLHEREDRRVAFARVCNSKSLKLMVTFLPLFMVSSLPGNLHLFVFAYIIHQLSRPILHDSSA